MKNLHSYAPEQLFQTIIIRNPDHPDYLWNGVIDEIIDENYAMFRKLGTHTKYSMHRDDMGFVNYEACDRSFEGLMAAIKMGELRGDL